MDRPGQQVELTAVRWARGAARCGNLERPLTLEAVGRCLPASSSVRGRCQALSRWASTHAGSDVEVQLELPKRCWTVLRISGEHGLTWANAVLAGWPVTADSCLERSSCGITAVFAEGSSDSANLGISLARGRRVAIRCPDEVPQLSHPRTQVVDVEVLVGKEFA